MCSLQRHISTQQPLLGRRGFNLWDSMVKFKDSLPQGLRQEFLAILEPKGKLARASLQAALDAAKSAARMMVSAVL